MPVRRTSSEARIRGGHRRLFEGIWVSVKELKLSYHNPEIIFFPIYPYSGIFKYEFLNSNPGMALIQLLPSDVGSFPMPLRSVIPPLQAPKASFVPKHPEDSTYAYKLCVYAMYMQQLFLHTYIYTRCVFMYISKYIYIYIVYRCIYIYIGCIGFCGFCQPEPAKKRVLGKLGRPPLSLAMTRLCV